MPYPSMEQVEAADHEQICRWHRFLDSPGMSAIDTDQFDTVLDREVEIAKRIYERYMEFGGMTPELSKRIGWGPQR